MQIDHVGRSNRSQQGRFDFLNTLHPSRHVAAIKDETQTRSRIEKTIMEYLPPFVNAYQPLFKIRPYDLFPDVMIYTKQYAIKFPNGRELKDDVGAQTCDQGDCALVEGSYIDSPKWPRATANDKPFLTEFPYLAEKWDEKEIAPKPAEPVGLLGTLGALRDVLAFTLEAVANCCSAVKMAVLVKIVVLVLIIVIAVIALIGWRRCRRRVRPERFW